MRLYFELPEGSLIVMENAIQQMHAYKQARPRDKEAGGLLIGRFPTQGEHRVIEDVTTPLIFDKRRRAYFFRSMLHNLKLRRAWIKSKRTLTLLGTWHTHPEPNPTPSGVDLDDWRTLLGEGNFEGDSLAFIIVGTGKTNAWLGNKKGNFQKLKPSTGYEDIDD